MATFLPCPSCGRHIRTSEHACPFCAHGSPGRDIIGRILSPLPELLPALVLGLSLAACDGPRPAEKYGAPPPPPAAATGDTTPDPTTAEAGDAEAGDSNVGADAGAEVTPDPRPAEKYGGPPLDDDPELKEPKPELREPVEPDPETGEAPPEGNGDSSTKPSANDSVKPEPRPAKKYGGPPRPDRPEKSPLEGPDF